MSHETKDSRADALLEKATKAALRTRHEMTEQAIRRGLVEGWRYVYEWEAVQGESIVMVASEGPPEPGERVLGHVTRYELGDGLLIDRADMPTVPKP